MTVNDFKIFDLTNPKHAVYTTLIFKYINNMLYNQSYTFFANILSKFDFRFFDSDKFRDLYTYIDVDNNIVTLYINPKIFFNASDLSIYSRLILDVNNILKKNILLTGENSPEVSFIEQIGNNGFVKHIPLELLCVNYDNFLELKGSDFFLNTTKLYNESERQNKETHYDTILRLAYTKIEPFVFTGSKILVDIPLKNIVFNWSKPKNPDETNNYIDALISEIQTNCDQRHIDIPGQYKHIFDKTEVNTKWFSMFKRYTANHISSQREASKRRLNKRCIVKNQIQQNTKNKLNLDIVVAIDTSVSIDLKDYNKALNYLYEIVKINGITLTLVQFDSKVNLIEKNPKINNTYLTNLNYTQGGTSFSNLFKTINKQNLTPDIFLIFTDGFGGEFELGRINKNNILWVLPENNKKPKLGKHLIIN